MKKIFCILFSILLLNTTIAFAKEVIIFGNNYKIPKIYSKNGIPKGILINIAKYIDQQMSNYTFNYKLYPWARAYESAEQGLGGIIGLSKNQERLKKFDYSDVVYYDDVIIVVLKGKEFPYEKINDLKGKTIGIGMGGSFGNDFEKAKKTVFKVNEDNGPVNRLKMLLRERIDCAFISPGKIALELTINQDEELLQNKEKFIILPKAFKQDPNFLAFSKEMKMQNFLNEFNDALKQGNKNGDIKKIITSEF